jgi:hypothetical protein
MKQTISVAVQSVMPPVIWRAIQRMRGLASMSPWREFGAMATCANASPILSGKFADLYREYRPLDPHLGEETWRYRLYNVASFARRCCNVPGDFVCAGVSWGVAPRIVFDYADLLTAGKSLHLIDPFEGIVSNTSNKTSQIYNCNPDYVLRQYPQGSSVVLHRDRVPLRLGLPLAFVFTDTGNPAADAAAIPHLDAIRARSHHQAHDLNEWLLRHIPNKDDTRASRATGCTGAAARR